MGISAVKVDWRSLPRANPSDARGELADCGVGIDHQCRDFVFNVTLAIDAMTDRPEVHAHSVTRVFPRIGETGTAREIMELLERRARS